VGDFTLRWTSVPYVIQVASLLVLAGFVALIRGSQLIRASLLFLVLAAMPWSLAVALCGSVNDPALANMCSKFGVGAVSILGVALMMVLLTISGRFERHRQLFGVALVLATTTAIITWSTDLVVGESWRTSWGQWVHRAGPLSDLHISQFVIWSAIGVVLSRRGNRALMSERQRTQVKYIVVGLAVALLSVSDTLLTRGIGVYPFSFVPSIFAIWFAIYACAKHDLLRSRGFDWAGMYELLLVGVLAIGVGLFFLVTASSPKWSSPVVTTSVLAPLLLATYGTVLVIRKRTSLRLQAVEVQGAATIDLFVEQAREVRAETELRDKLADLLTKHLTLSEVRLYLQDESGLWSTVVDQELPPVKLDARVRAWLMNNQAPLITDELLTQRLGGLRKPIEAFMSIIRADIVVPMVDRDRIVGLVATSARTDDRALRAVDKMELMQAAQASARALTYLRLVRDARAKIEIAKEVEVAAAVQQARASGHQVRNFGNAELTSFYQPAAQFGGHWSMCSELADGRLLLVIGDVSGHGVSAALISFTVEGACETALRMFGASFDVLSLLELLNRAVLDVGKGAYAMSCFAAIVDPDDQRVVFANAGHPFPYIVRRAETPSRGKAELRALVSRGTPLGTAEPVLSVASMELETDDVLVFYSDSIVDSRDPAGKSYGDRRFQRVLRSGVRDAGARACEVIMRAANDHYGDRAIDEDLNLFVLRLGVG